MALGPEVSDEQLLEQARDAAEGDLRAFEELARRYQERLLANCRYLVRSATQAEDLAQEVLIKVYFGMDGFEGRSSVRTWIQRIKVNHCLNHLKKQSARTFVELDEVALSEADRLSVDPQAEIRLTAASRRERIERALDSLSDTLRVPLIMRDLDQMSYREVSDALGIGLSAAKMRIKRGREEFQRRYRRQGEDPAAAAAGEP